MPPTGFVNTASVPHGIVALTYEENPPMPLLSTTTMVPMPVMPMPMLPVVPPASVMMPPPTLLTAKSIERCRYRSKFCRNHRAFKPNGTMHLLCEFHRFKANLNQKRWTRAKRGARLLHADDRPHKGRCRRNAQSCNPMHPCPREAPDEEGNRNDALEATGEFTKEDLDDLCDLLAMDIEAEPGDQDTVDDALALAIGHEPWSIDV